MACYVVSGLLVSLVPARSASPCLPYEPAIVQVSGHLVRKVFPEPPNYDDIRAGDEKAFSGSSGLQGRYASPASRVTS